ncbi:winged helix-turn-helix transcriptional regulator [Candidatus Saccharibacteria bacterium]|nr:winged helix-turn-helix transcriptional regulator [Candidatus Saccharibacteria bacterium]MCB9834421.1 winged helix-turn-helix transcriptional regulator [Candidatus Nomurabacteria bacterium]
MSKPISLEIQTIFSALGDQSRYQIYGLLHNHPGICVSELANQLGVSTSAVSQQLRILESSGLIRHIRAGKKVCYQVSQSFEGYQQISQIISMDKNLISRKE